MHLARGLEADPARGAGDQRHLSVQVVDGHRLQLRAVGPQPDPLLESPARMPGFRPVDPKQSFPELEERVLARWRERDVFHRSLANREGAEVWSFYEGPPTANGRPGSHHVLARVFKDVYPRYRTMCGYRVPRKAGWDCHGLPVELEVEKELGISSKQEIEEYGIAEFNAALPRVGLRVRRGVEPADRADRLLDRPRRPLRHPRGRLHRVGLVVAAQALGRRTASTRATRSSPTARAAAPRSPRTRSRSATRTSRTPPYTCASRCSARTASEAGESLLVWTTTPWTLPGNVAVAVAPEVTYVRARVDDETLILAEPLVEKVLGEEAEILDRFPGSDLVGRRYSGPVFDARRPRAAAASRSSPATSSPPRTAPASSTSPPPSARTTTRSPPRTGSSTRPTHGTLYNPVGLDGTFDDRVTGFEGRFVKDPEVTAALIADLERRGLLFREQVYEHAYPHCWRCGTPLLYYAKSSWYVAHLAGARPAARQQRGDRLAPRAHQARPLRQMAGEQRRLGALARPLLGDAAADLGVRRRGLRRALLRRLGRRAARARPRRGPRRPAPPLHRRGRRSTARTAAARCAGSSR